MDHPRIFIGGHGRFEPGILDLKIISVTCFQAFSACARKRAKRNEMDL